MFLGVKLRKRSKKWQKKLACFLFKKQRRKKQKKRQNNDQLSTVVSSHKKKKKKTQIIVILLIMAPSSSSSNNASFTKIFEQIHHKDRGVCATLLRALWLSFYFSLSRPRRTAGIIIIDAFRRRDYISD